MNIPKQCIGMEVNNFLTSDRNALCAIVDDALEAPTEAGMLLTGRDVANAPS